MTQRPYEVTEFERAVIGPPSPNKPRDMRPAAYSTFKCPRRQGG
jgi:hypothetical protein